ncbi:putative porin [Nibrella saemangeumensis]
MKQLHLRYLLLLLCFGCTTAALAQFPNMPRLPQGGGRPGSSGPGGGIDDSTKVIYGPTTTRFFLESDVFNNRRTLYTIDTLLDGVHMYNFVQRNENLYQDLGSLGTPMRPVFYLPPAQIGAQTGYSVYSPYAYQTQQVRYYDTKSPFTNMYLVLGGRNQNLLNFDLAQNITPRWNVGINVQRFTSQKQFGTSGSSDPQRLLVENWGFLGHTNYRSKNEKYTLLLHFNHMNHEMADQGGLLDGIQLVGDDTIQVQYDYEGRARLNQAGTRELRNDWHLYHQYVLDQGLQVYHRLDYRRHINGFTDEDISTDLPLSAAEGIRPFYPSILYDSTKTIQDVRYRLVDNNFGLKGIYRGFNYRAYYRQRFYRQNGRYNDSPTTFNTYRTQRLENFVGLWLGYYFPDSTSRITAEAEYLLGRDFRLEGQLESRWFTAGYRSIFSSPTLIQERFQSNNFFWRNNFGLQGTNHAYGMLNLRLKKWRFQPALDYFLLNNYIYFDTHAAPRQFTGAFSVLRTGLGAQYRTGKFQALSQAYYTLVSRGDLLRAPKFFLNARIAYDFLYAKVLFIQTGVELHYKSRYFADAYMPVSQQFHLQNDQQVEGYLLADVFANLRINRVRLFVKMSHANQGLFVPGYYVAPGYLQMRRTFGFGVHWYLFD